MHTHINTYTSNAGSECLQEESRRSSVFACDEDHLDVFLPCEIVDLFDRHSIEPWRLPFVVFVFVIVIVIVSD